MLCGVLELGLSVVRVARAITADVGGLGAGYEGAGFAALGNAAYAIP